MAKKKEKIKNDAMNLEIESEKKQKNLPKDSLSEILEKRKDMLEKDFEPKVAVIGVGGGGGNMLNNLVKLGLEKVVTIACNTDAQALKKSFADTKIQLGPKLTHGHGAGANSKVGKIAAQESTEDIKEALKGVHMAFVVAGMGGGTGTGAAPEICKIAVEMGILTLGFVTTPFEFEGAKRKETADAGLAELQENCDILIVLGNQNLFSLSTKETTFINAFSLTDEVLCHGVQSVVNTISNVGLINTDLSDFFTIMRGRKSRARMGTGIASGEDRGLVAAQDAMANPLLEFGGMSAKDIDGIIICIRCGKDMTLSDINQAVDYVKHTVSENANIIFGATIDEAMEDKVQVAVFATSSKNSDVEDKNSDSIDEILNKSHNHQEEFKIENFQELIADDIEIGSAHNSMVHEDNHNQHFETINLIIPEKKQSILKRFFSLFKNKYKK